MMRNLIQPSGLPRGASLSEILSSTWSKGFTNRQSQPYRAACWIQRAVSSLIDRAHLVGENRSLDRLLDLLVVLAGAPETGDEVLDLDRRRPVRERQAIPHLPALLAAADRGQAAHAHRADQFQRLSNRDRRPGRRQRGAVRPGEIRDRLRL